MDIDLPFYLFWGVVITGAIWLGDTLFFAKARAEANQPEDGDADEPVIIEYARSFFPVLLLVFVIRGFVAEPYQIPSESMLPTLEVGDFILVNKYAYGLRMPVFKEKLLSVGEPARGDIMVFVPPHDHRYFIKRVIGIPGDRVAYADKRLVINGRELPYEFVRTFQDPRLPLSSVEYQEEIGGVKHKIHHSRRSERARSWVVGEGEYLMMGDNRDNSTDSRAWGMAQEENVVGKAVAVWAHKEPGWNLPTFEKNRWLGDSGSVPAE